MSESYARFTQTAREVMAAATSQAHDWGHEYVGREHVLLAMLEQVHCSGLELLRQLGVDPDRLWEDVRGRMERGPSAMRKGTLPQTPRVRHAIKYALDEARNAGKNQVGTVELLLGLIQSTDGIAAEELKRCGITLEGMRNALSDISVIVTPIPDGVAISFRRGIPQNWDAFVAQMKAACAEHGDTNPMAIVQSKTGD
jgi:ATP-dependent Clp protease ATP-binding subunit ClpC